MKQLFFIAIALMSCQKPDPHIEAIMSEFKRTANDPASIEYVETLAIDTLTLINARRNAIARETRVYDAILRTIEASEGLMEVQAKYRGIEPETKADHDNSLLQAAAQTSKIDSIKSILSSPDSNKVVEVYYYSSIRGKNAMGALVLNQYKATFNNDSELLDLSTVEQ